MADIRSARWLAFLAAMLLAARNKPADRRTQVHPKGIQFHGVEGGKPFVLDIRGEACEDTMSGQNFAFTATFDYTGRTLAGCARPAN